jgi:DNA repair photolyase
MSVRGKVPEPAVVPGLIVDGGYDGVVKIITSMFPAALKVVSTTRPEVPNGWDHVPRQAPVDAKTLSLDRIHPKYLPVWKEKSQADREALSKYFLPLGSQKPLLRPTSRPKLIKWYCPGADQNVFASGHRYEINVFNGCGHYCIYCFVGPACPKPKRDFEKLLRKDLENLERFNVPPAPVHMSNSTDPFQPLEPEHGHTKFALEGLLRYRHRFTTVTLTTKNPLLAARSDYLSLLQSLGKIGEDHPKRELFLSGERPPCQVEVSMSFWREEARRFWEPKTPTLEERIEGMRALRAAGVPVVLRIDPLFPRSPITTGPRSSLSEFGIKVEPQTLDDLEQLVQFAKEINVRQIVYKVVKIVQPVRSSMILLKNAFEAMARPEELVFRGGSWRLPRRHVDLIADPFLEICNRHGVPAKFCIKNVLEIP